MIKSKHKISNKQAYFTVMVTGRVATLIKPVSLVQGNAGGLKYRLKPLVIVVVVLVVTVVVVVVEVVARK